MQPDLILTALVSVLPKFEVSVQMPSYVLSAANTVPLTVSARY